jgi:hypothetical protein
MLLEAPRQLDIGRRCDSDPWIDRLGALVGFEIRGPEPRRFERGGKPADASNDRESLFDGPTLALVSVVQSTGEAAACKGALVVNRAPALAEPRAGRRERRARLLEAPATPDDAKATPSSGVDLVRLEIHTPEQRAVTAQPARLAEGLEGRVRCRAHRLHLISLPLAA